MHPKGEVHTVLSSSLNGVLNQQSACQSNRRPEQPRILGTRLVPQGVHSVLVCSVTGVALHHGVMLLQDLHIMDELVLLLGHSLVMHAVEVALLPELVPGGRRLHA